MKKESYEANVTWRTANTLCIKVPRGTFEHGDRVNVELTLLGHTKFIPEVVTDEAGNPIIIPKKIEGPRWDDGDAEVKDSLPSVEGEENEISN